MNINNIEYTEENKLLFDEFIKPVTIDDIDKHNKYNSYRDNLKGFLKDNLMIDINIYFTKGYRGKLYFYIIEGIGWYKSSDEIEDCDILSYNTALNRAIRYVFQKILNNK